MNIKLNIGHILYVLYFYQHLLLCSSKIAVFCQESLHDLETSCNGRRRY